MEKENAVEKDSWNGDYWTVILLMILFGFGSFGKTDTSNYFLIDEIAELKGKMSVIEKIVLSDRGN